MPFFQDLKARVRRTPSPQPGGRAPSLSPSPMPWNRSPSTKAEKSEKAPGYPSEKGAGSSSAFRLAPEDSPPPYTPTATAAPPAVTITEPRGELSDNDPYGNLARFETVLLIDDSSSMQHEGNHGMLREEARQALRAIAETVVQYDSSGVDVYLLNHKSKSEKGIDGKPVDPPAGRARGGYYNIKTAEEVDRIFGLADFRGLTPMGESLFEIFAAYRDDMIAKKRDSKKVQPMNVIVVTDGRPTDDAKTEIINIAKQLERLQAPSYQFGIQFFQIGSNEEATRFLKSLDDDLNDKCHRDIVDTTPCQWDTESGDVKQLTSEAILKVVLGAVDKRIDEMKLDI